MSCILRWGLFNYAFYVIRSPGESMTEILFPSRLSDVNSYPSLIICYIGRIVRPQLAEMSIKEWIVWEIYNVNPWMDVLNIQF